MRYLLVSFILLLSIHPCFARPSAAQYAGQNLMTAKQLAAKGETARALLIANRVIEEVKASPKSRKQQELLMEAYTLNGNNYNILGDSQQALSYFRNALRIAAALGNEQREGQLYNNIFSIYYALHDYNQATDLLNSALNIALKLGDRNRICTIYNNMGLVAYEQSDHKRALQLLDKALLYTRPGDVKNIASVLTNKAEVHYDRGEYKATNAILDSVLSLLGTHNQPQFIQPYLNAALVKARLGKTSELAPLLRTIYKRLSSCPPPVQSNSYRQLAEIHFQLGDSLAGLHDMLRSERVADSTGLDSNNKQVRQLLIAYQADRLKQSNNQLEALVSSRTMLLVASLLFLVILIILAVSLYRQMRLVRQKARQITRQQKLLHEYERKESERQRQALSLEIDHKNRQLTSYAIDTAAMNEFHAKVRDGLSQIKSEVKGMTPEQQQQLTDLMNSLLHYNDKMVADDFRLYFDEVHPQMLKKLALQYPQLSEKDLHLCAFLHLGMSTKEIAALTSREVRSVDSARNRLRKKLGLAPQQSLQQFLKGFA